ncbi:uncharacterized protein VDAG_09000 [Verticillium dahliae VdLs.17]|uniref:Uncharacterized protein n=1 Tax=Verticillium dahliae (strain VdLs.17 / ATCC MYA-4575 / FGSC 10137) TaxID=498257 RepID=G2XG21_VERDV|nr:uncharacterized protein VDAG_09000 [Verticillium dahliae VdLs.17]EGY18840.1 hypothetical protein VDAG_09000 [Verticillium dahliae VdLs.17]
MGVSRCKWRREEWRPGLLMGAWEHRYTGGFCVRAAGGTRVGFFFLARTFVSKGERDRDESTMYLYFWRGQRQGCKFRSSHATRAHRPKWS